MLGFGWRRSGRVCSSFVFPEGVGCRRHETDQFREPSVGSFDEVVLFGVDVLDRGPFGGYFSAEKVIPAYSGLVGDQCLVGSGGWARGKPKLQLGGLFGEVGGEAKAEDGEEVWAEKCLELGGELCEEVKTPLVAGVVAALHEVVIGFVGEQTVRASIVIPGFSGVQAATNGEFFPAELREECLGLSLIHI